MKYLLACALALLPTSASAAKSVMEGIATTNNTLMVDTTTIRVGVGTATPGTRLHMSSGTLTVDGAGAGVNLPANSVAINTLATCGAGQTILLSGGIWTCTGMGAGVGWVVDNFLGQVTGSKTAFTLSSTPSSAASILLILDGKLLSSASDYTYTSGTTVTMTTAPAVNTESFFAMYTITTSTSANAMLINSTETVSGQKTFMNSLFMSGTSFMLTGSGGFLASESSITTKGSFFGDGSHLTGISAGGGGLSAIKLGTATIASDGVTITSSGTVTSSGAWVGDGTYFKISTNGVVGLSTGTGAGTWTDWTPSWTGFSSNQTFSFSRYSQVGSVVSINTETNGVGTSNTTAFTMTLPVAAKNTGRFIFAGQDNGVTANVFGYTAANSTTMTFFYGFAENGWTASGTKFVKGLNFSYEANTNVGGLLSSNQAVLSSTQTISGVDTFANHVNLTGSVAPTLSGCGASPTLSTGASDSAGQITTNSTSCQLDFGTAYTNTPICIVVVANNGGTQGGRSVTTAHLALSGVANGQVYDYMCFGK